MLGLAPQLINGAAAQSDGPIYNEPQLTATWQIVSVEGSTNGDGFVLFNNSTRAWIDYDCRTTLEENGRYLKPVPWPVIDAKNPIARPSCDDILNNTIGSRTNPIPIPTPNPISQPTSLWQLVSVKNSTNGDGFILFGNGTQAWVDRPCRQTLESQGRFFRPVNWNVIEVNTPVSRPTCDEIGRNTIGSSANPVNPPHQQQSWRLVSVKGSTNGDGFVLFGNGTRHWINRSCRQELQSSGRLFDVLDWSAIDPNVQVDDQPSCNKIAENTLALGIVQPFNN